MKAVRTEKAGKFRRRAGLVSSGFGQAVSPGGGGGGRGGGGGGGGEGNLR